MKCFYISIEKNVEGFEFYKVLWSEHNVNGIRVGSMTEGIERAIKIEKSRDKLFFISIVADDIDFMPQLRILSDETCAPILIATSKVNYNEKMYHEALKNGADFYGQYCDEARQNIAAVLSVISSINRRAMKQRTLDKIIADGDILMDVEHHRVFFKDKEVPLTNAEMRILYYMMINRGIILGYSQISCNAYSYCDDKTLDSLYSAIKRIRKKIRNVTQTKYIETINGVGYRLLTKGYEK